MFSRLISIPFVFGLIIFGYLAFAKSSSYSVYIIPFVVILAIIYVMSPQLDWWWYKRNPPDIDERLKKIFELHDPFYAQLSEPMKLRFRQRTAMYMLGNAFIMQSREEDMQVPEDIKGWVAAHAVQVTFGLDDYLMNSFERIVIYGHPFPSPQFPAHFHSCENFEEDGVILFSIEQAIQGVLNPNTHFNTLLYEYGNVFQSHFKNIKSPHLEESLWEAMEKISDKPTSWAKNTIGLPEISLFSLCLHHFFKYPENFQKIQPEFFQKLQNLLNLNPINKKNPIISNETIAA